MSTLNKKLVSLFLAAVMLFCALPMAYAASPDRSVTMTVGEATADGLVPLYITAHNYIGVQDCFFELTFGENISIASLEKSPDIMELDKTNCNYYFGGNVLNGKLSFAPFGSSLLTLEEYKANLKDGQSFSDSFDPNHFVLMIVYLHFGPGAENPATVTLKGEMSFGYEKEKDAVNETIQVSKPTQKDTVLIRYAYYGYMGLTDLPKPQIKEVGSDITLSTDIPKNVYVVRFFTEGSVSPDRKTVEMEFSHWNTRYDGSGKSYMPGDVYTEDEDLVLYSQWIDPAMGELPVPERPGYTFLGWFIEWESIWEVTEDTIINRDNLHIHGNNQPFVYARWSAKRGDVDISDSVTADDARFVLRGSVGLEELDAEQTLLADMDGDALITAADARSVLRTAVALDELQYVNVPSNPELAEAELEA